jgi:hypothetical protein
MNASYCCLLVAAAATAAESAPPPEVLPAAAVAFGPRVQPILMNACASCHAAKGYAGTFKLDRVAAGYANPAATAANLRAAAAQLAPANPANSPLVRMAVTPHGGQKTPAFHDRLHPAVANLEAWARAALPPAVAPTAVAAAPPPARLPPLKPEPTPAPMTPSPVVQAVAVQPAAPPPPAAAPNPADPFDPAAFNALPKR